jgi:hypothetical protein
MKEKVKIWIGFNWLRISTVACFCENGRDIKGEQFLVGLKAVLPGVTFILWIQTMCISSNNNNKINMKAKMCYLGD